MLLVLSDSSAVILPSSKSPLSVSALRSVSSPSVCLVPVGGVHWYAVVVGGGLQGEDKAIISANETALSQSTNVPASAAAPARVCWCVSACVRQCLRGNVRKVRQRSFSCKRMSPPPPPFPSLPPPHPPLCRRWLQQHQRYQKTKVSCWFLKGGRLCLDGSEREECSSS